jgi:hypothetical protein
VARYNPLKIEQSVPELYPRLVQYVNGSFYDGSGNLLRIGVINNPNKNKLVISDGTNHGLTSISNLTFENGTLSVSGNLQLVNGTQKDRYILISDSNGLATWTSSNIRTTEIDSASYSIDNRFEYYGVTYTGGICEVYLPLGVNSEDNGRTYTIADEVGGISNFNRGIKVISSDTQTINGYSDILMKVNRMSLTFMFRNGLWKTI